MLSLEDLRAAVDPYRGSVRFTTALATLPGLNGPDYSLRLAYDSGQVDRTVEDWNLSAPTGVAGLGWSLQVDRITAVYGDPLGSGQALDSRRLTLHLGGEEYTLVQTARSGPTVTYVTQPARFWQVSYQAANETWQVVQEDGTVLTFGDAGGPGTVDWGYAWGNWLGASVRAGRRNRVPVGWSLARTADLWGNGFTFAYQQVTANLAGDPAAPYTRATYLQTVTGSGGGSLTLAYTAKGADEYIDPHSGAAAAAWQSRFATQVLATVSHAAPGGAVLTVTTLDYTGPGGTVQTIGTGTMTKRLLMGVSHRAPGGYDLPDLSFTYELNPTADAYGALLTVTTPAGGVASYRYSRPSDLSLPLRDRRIAPPVRQGVTYDTPRLFFGPQYTVVLWHGSDNSTAATAYRWEGRWLEAAVACATAADATAYGSLQVALGEDCFAIVGATDYAVHHTDSNRPGAWVGPTAPEPTGLPAGEPMAVAAGEGYAALLATRSGTMVVRWFDGGAWQTLNCPAAAGTTLAAMGGASGVLARLSSTGGGATHDLLLVHPDPVAGWVSTTFQVPHWAAALDGLSVQAGDFCAVVGFTGPSGPYRGNALYAVQWNAGFTGVGSTLLKQGVSSGPAPSVALRGATVLTGQDVYRFDGAAWRHQDLSALTHPGQAQVACSLGADLVTRTVMCADGSVLCDLIAYNPADTGTTPWAYVSGMSGVPARSGTASASMAARFGPWAPGAASRFVLFNNQLYVLQGDGTWASVLTVQATFDPQTIPSLCLYADTYLLYQTGSGVTAYPLRGGGLAAEIGVVLSGGRVLTGTDQVLTGQAAFVSYTGTWDQGDAVLTLHRPVAGDVRGALAPLVVTALTLRGSGGTSDAPGYNTVSTAFDFAAATATVTADGHGLCANQTRMVPGTTDPEQGAAGYTVTAFFNGLAAAESPARPYPTGEQTNAGAGIAHLGGLVYLEQTYAQGQAQPEAQSTYWWWSTVVPAGARAVGVYNRCRQSLATLDGVPVQHTMSYSPDTGLPVQTRMTRADGQVETVAETYWWEKYDPTRSRNLLTPVVQSLRSVGGALVEGRVTTWHNWGAGGGRWAPRARYVASAADAVPFASWTGPVSPPPAGWLLTEQVCARTGAGTVLLTRDALGVPGSSLTDRWGRTPLSTFTNADATGQEAYFYGLEPYEFPGPWQYLGGDLPSHVVQGEANLGTCSLAIAPDTAGLSGPVATIVPAGQSRAYRFSCWIETPKGFDGVTGTAQFTLSVYNVGTGQPVGDPVTLPMPATDGAWQSIGAVVDLGALRTAHSIPTTTKLSITVLGYNQKASQQVLVDGLTLAPADAGFYGRVPDPATGLLRGSLGLNGNTYHAVRDANGIITATVGPDPTVARVKMPSFARLLTADGTYQENLPNMILEATAGSAAQYQNFEASDTSRWQLPTGWTMGGGRLAFTGSAPGPRGSQAALLGFTHANHLARVRYLPPDSGARPNVGIGCGNILTYHDARSGAWVLTALQGGHWTNLATQAAALPAGDLVFFVLDGRVNLFAAGEQIFSYQLTGITPDGTVNLWLTGPGAFADLVVLAEPQVRLEMFDGRGVAVQALDLDRTAQVDAGGTVYDPLGVVSYDKNPVYVPLAAAGNRIAGGTSAYLPPAGGQPQTLQQYLTYGNGSPFERTGRETSPLGRPQQFGQPGDLLAIGGSHAARIAYAQNTAGGPMAGLVPDTVAGNYHLSTLTDANANTLYSLTAPTGEVRAQRMVLAGGQSLTYGFAYDGAGRLITVTPPNAYGGGGDRSADWTITLTRDFLGRVTAVSTPDAGTTWAAYDSLGRRRFVLDPAGAAENPPRIWYWTYDNMNRVVQTGYLQRSGITWETVQAQVDVTGWPDTGQHPTVTRSCLYDTGSGALAGANTAGRLWQVCTHGAGGAVQQRQTYSYDARGNILTQWTEAPGYDGTIWMITYTYDSRDRIVHIGYPRPHTAPQEPFAVDYTYDRLGRVGAVTGAQAVYGTFTYNPDNTVGAAGYNNPGSGATVSLTRRYSTASWPVATTSPVYSESVTYTAGGYGSAAYYDSRVASVHGTWRATPDALHPLLDQTARFAYDAAGRMVAASPYMGDDTGGDALPIRYDAGGNLLSVRRGNTVSAYAYPTGGTGNRMAGEQGSPSNRLQTVTATLQASCDFSTDSPLAGWVWGATNGGPDGARVTDGGPEGSKCLQVSGAAAGAAGYLEYRGPVHPAGQYTLTYSLKSAEGFTTQPGGAGWYAVLHGPHQEVATLQIKDLSSAPTVWTAQTVTVDLQGLLANQALWAQVTEVSLRLLNFKRSADTRAGAALQVAAVRITGSGGTGTLTYGPDGCVTGVPGTGLSQMQYDPQSQALIAMQTARDGGAAVEAQLDAFGDPVLVTTTPKGAAPDKCLNLWGPPGMLLARLDSGVAGQRRRYCVQGPEGMFAVQDDGRMCYVIRGQDGTVKAAVDEQCRTLYVQAVDAFGEVRHEAGTNPVPGDVAAEQGAVQDENLPGLGRSLVPRLEDGYTDELIQGRHEVYSDAWYDAIRRVYDKYPDLKSLIEDIGKVQKENKDKTWYEHTQSRNTWQGLDFETARPVAWQRFFTYWWANSQCRVTGIQAISVDAMAEDMFHGVLYADQTGVDARDLATDPPGVGAYIFVVTPDARLLYRTLCDRTRGEELYVRHSQLNGGHCALTAGQMLVKEGKEGKRVVDLSNGSGHYLPSGETVRNHAVPLLKARNYSVDNVWDRWWERGQNIKHMVNENRGKWCPVNPEREVH